MNNEFPKVSPYSFPGLGKIPKLSNQGTEVPKKKRFKQVEILELVANEFNVTMDSILSKSRVSDVVNARYVYFAAVKMKLKKSLNVIGKETSGRDHSSVIHGLMCFKDRFDTEEDFRQSTKNVFSIIGLVYNGERLTASNKNHVLKNFNKRKAQIR